MKLAIDALTTMKVRSQNALDSAKNSLNESEMLIVDRRAQVAQLENQILGLTSAIDALKQLDTTNR